MISICEKISFIFMLLSFHFEPFWLLLSKVEIKHDFFLKLRSPTGKIYTIQFKACIFLLS